MCFQHTDQQVYWSNMDYQKTRRKGKLIPTSSTWVTPTPLDQNDRSGLTELGSPVLSSQAADAGVSPSVVATHRAGGGAHAGAVEPSVHPPDRVAPQPVTAGQAATAALPAGFTLTCRAHQAAAASVLHLSVVTGLWRDRALRSIADLRAGLSFSQQTCMNRGREEGKVNYKLHHELKSVHNWWWTPPHTQSQCCCSYHRTGCRPGIRLLLVAACWSWIHLYVPVVV